jgi:hypothetical protein
MSNLHQLPAAVCLLSERIGVIVTVDITECTITVCCFISWVELYHHDGHKVFDEVLFWPADSYQGLPFLCDTDRMAQICLYSIQGIAFVFHIDDPIAKTPHVIRDAYQVLLVF